VSCITNANHKCHSGQEPANDQHADSLNE